METFWLHEKSYPFLGVAELKRGSPFRDISLLGTLDVGDSRKVANEICDQCNEVRCYARLSHGQAREKIATF